MGDQTPTPLGLRLKQARLMTHPPTLGEEDEPRAGWQCLSQRELAELAGRSDGLVGHVERGTTKGVGSETARRYAEVLGITLDWLLTGTGPPHRESEEELDAEIVNAAVLRAKEAHVDAA
jgi:hypothetical protein